MFRNAYTFRASQKSFGHILSLLLLLTLRLFNNLCFAARDFFPSDICQNFWLILSLLRDIFFIRLLKNHLPFSCFLLFNSFFPFLLKLIRDRLSNLCNDLFRNILFLRDSRRIIMLSFSPFFLLSIHFNRSTFVFIFKTLILFLRLQILNSDFRYLTIEEGFKVS